MNDRIAWRAFLLRAFGVMYGRLIRLYPRRFQQTFGAEMEEVFAQVTDDAFDAGLFAGFWVALRELLHSPGPILRANFAGLGQTPSPLDLALQPAAGAAAWPDPPDGRQSWRQAIFETLLFLLTGAALVAATYLPTVRPANGWQHDLDFLGIAVLILPLPAFLLGLALGLPRWAYPPAGLVLGYSFLAAQTYHLLWWWGSVALALLAAAFATAQIAARWPLPARVRRLVDNLRKDWTRLSFAVYGLAPVLLLVAYDDAHTNARTPYFALSALAMLGGALGFTRSRQAGLQVGFLLLGLSCAILPAALDMAQTGGAGSIFSTIWLQHTAWVFRLWAAAAGLLLAPGIIAGMRRLAGLRFRA